MAHDSAAAVATGRGTTGHTSRDGLLDLSGELDNHEAKRQFIVELFALEGTEDGVDDIAEGLAFEVDETRLHFRIEAKIDDITLPPVDLAELGGRSVILSESVVTRSETGTVSLTSPARTDGSAWGTGIAPSTVTLEVDVPGALLHTDADSLNGNTVEWTWKLGQAAEPGMDLEWDPTAQKDGCELCGAFAPFIVFILALFALLGLGILAASFGLIEGWRVTRRDRRDIGRDDESP